jgi:RNA polymerase sigma-70 factor (ECF subfamily)
MLSICLALLQNQEDTPRFEEFYNKFYDLIYLIAKDHLKTKEAAEDCAQEIMIRFAKDFHNITQDFDDKKFKNYVRVISKCMAIDMYRKEKKHTENVVDAGLSEFYNIYVEKFEVCDKLLLKQAVDAMPESYRYVFYLKYYFELTGEEIAKKTGISHTYVRQKCLQGMNFVRKYVEEAEKN